MPPPIAARWITRAQPRVALRASAGTRRSPVWTSQPSRIHCGAGRWSDDAHLVGGVGEQPPDDRGADRARAARDQHAAHPRRRLVCETFIRVK